MEELEAKSNKDLSLKNFQTTLSTFMMMHFEKHPEELPLLNEKQVHFEGFKADKQVMFQILMHLLFNLTILLQIFLYGMIKSNYSSVADWTSKTDIL